MRPTTSNSMERLFTLLLASLLITLVSSEDDWANCTPCRCAWVNGRKNADCKKNASVILSNIPTNLSAEIRSIDFTDQQLFHLQRDIFQRASLGDLQKIKLVNCQLQEVDRNAFRNMTLLIELDMSKNSITNLYADTFRTNPRLRILYLNENNLEELNDGLFANLTFLQRVELMHNKIHTIGLNTFVNNNKLQHILLDYNKLVNLSKAFTEKLDTISYLSLQENPWKCDCHLKDFRDFAIKRNLLTHASLTSCSEPERLKDRRWTDLESSDFACRPRIIIPPNSFLEIEASNENVTLYCKVSGEPRPDVNWVFRHAIIDATPRRPGAQRYSLTHSDLGDSTYWFNLTIFGVMLQDGGIYKCAAKNPGGIQERNVSLIVTSNFGGGGIMGVGANASEAWILILFIILGIVLVILLITIILWCCVCKRRTVTRSKGDPMSPNGDISLEGTTAEMEKSLITAVNPVVKPPRQYSVPPSVASGVTEVSEVNRTLLDNDSVFAAGDDDSRSFDFIEPTPRKIHNYLEVDHGLRPERPYPPDLLSFPPRAVQISPAGSSASTVPDQTRLPPQHGPQSPIHSPLFDTPGIYRTLPYSRSQSPFTSPLGGPAIAPRSGYVTIPRRPRVPSWSSAPPSTPLAAEPVYDNLGLRTTAEGSSVLSLNKIGEVTPRPRPQPIVGYTQPPFQESPDIKKQQSSTHSLLNPTSPEGRDNWVRIAPEGSCQKSMDTSTDSRDVRRLSSASLASVPEGKKVPPRPPPKPKKSVPTGPLFEDEGEDGTEV